ncbi:hypothetical protein [Ferroplasma sp.]|uniref:hypothetical protein n=1 Tax=Ferroplasma sp. TaxID=2591003 RepID=UPI00307E8790
MVSDAIEKNKGYYMKSLSLEDQFSRLDAWYKVDFLIDNKILTKDYVVENKQKFLDLLTTTDEMVKVHAWVLARRFADAGYISKEDINKRKTYLIPYVESGDLTAWWNAVDLINGNYIDNTYLFPYKDIFIDSLKSDNPGIVSDAWHMVPLLVNAGIIKENNYEENKKYLFNVLKSSNQYIRLNAWETIIDLGEKGILKRDDILPYKEKAKELVNGEDLIKLTSLFDTTQELFLERLKNLDLMN